MNKIIFISLSVWMVILNSACSEEITTPVTPEIKFNFSSPLANSTYAYGDTVWITGSVTWELEMHGYELTLQNSITNVNVLLDHKHIDDNMYEISEYWVNKVNQPTNFVFTFSAIKNHISEEKSTFQRTVKCDGH